MSIPFVTASFRKALGLAVPGMILVCTPVAAGTAPDPAGAAQPRVWRGAGLEGGKTDPGAEVVQDADRWDALWRSLNQSTPAFDFTRSVAVVAYAGTRPNPGYAVEFREPIAQGDDLVVIWQVVPPLGDTMYPQVLAHPWAIQAFPRPRGQVKVSRAIFNT